MTQINYADFQLKASAVRTQSRRQFPYVPFQGCGTVLFIVYGMYKIKASNEAPRVVKETKRGRFREFRLVCSKKPIRKHTNTHIFKICKQAAETAVVFALQSFEF